MGCAGTVVGKLVVNTASPGYEELLTDPANMGFLLAQTASEVGCYGVSAGMSDKKVTCAGYIARTVCRTPSNFASVGTLEEFLVKNGTIGICDIDTRALARHISTAGEMYAAITCDAPDAAAESMFVNMLKFFAPSTALEDIGVSSPVQIAAENPRGIKIGLYDFGASEDFVAKLAAKGFDVVRLPVFSSGECARREGVSALVISDGPEGLVSADSETSNRILGGLLELTKSGLPILAVGTGHLLLARACGAALTKIKAGRRGSSFPVRDEGTGRVFVASQNTSLAAIPESLGQNVEYVFRDVDDNTCVGVKYKNFTGLGIAFSPHLSIGAESDYLFEILSGGEQNTCR